MRNNKQLLAVLALSGLIGVVQADEKDELLKLRNTTVNLIKQLVKQGVLSEKVAQNMIEQAEADAAKQVAQAKAAGGAAKAAASGAGSAAGEAAATGVAAAGAAAKQAVPADEIRIAYVPDFVKDEIRQQVRSELREEVVGDVMQKAKDEQWGMPNALPEWTKRFTLSGDIRLRDQSGFMGSDNVAYNTSSFSSFPTQSSSSFNGIPSYPSSYLNYNAINGVAGYSATPQFINGLPNQNAYLNTKNNQTVGRERFRFGIDAVVNDSVDAGIRLTTGNTQNPVSTNQSLGNTGFGYQFAVDRAFLRYRAFDNAKFNWLTLMGGRTPSPFFTGGSELVWDEDLSFEGIAVTVRQRLGFSELADEIGGKGPSVYATTGIFDLQGPLNSPTNPFSTNTTLQKWLLAGQAGLEWGFDNQDTFKFGAAYYDFQGVKGIVNKSTFNNSCSSPTIDPNVAASAPQFIQGGNSMVGLCNTLDTGTDQNTNLYTSPGLYGLASNYKILDINAIYDFALFSPVHLKVSADYAKNLGFDANKTYAALGLPTVANQSTAWQVKFDLGWPRVDVPGNWSAFAAYRYLESDAALSSYTDSDFHLGMTNVKGWMMGGHYGLMKNVWLTGKWMSADMITGPAFSMDILQADINTHF